MTGKTHVGIGVISAVALSQYKMVELSLGGLLVCAIASLLPDIDHPKALLNKYILPIKNKAVKTTIYFTLGVFFLLLNFFYLNLKYVETIGIFFVLTGFSSHRNGITHSLTGLLCFGGTFGYAARIYGFKEYIVPFFIGYGLHLIADMFTNRGVSLFYPFKKKKYKMPITFAVGSFWGNLFEGLIISIGLIYLTFKLPEILLK
ncbi:metal-dependent hydrolase [Caloramator sp. CAR-1]|uniref:metal-dependent hydrolase n=1 Tax=Caloramator sp. CAR-1 TaxID=3062777 RepID=UPI0026E1EFCC|nr:metal-dependent hydrolase [Caloramator sp. CAR-1]MDO6355218.1 metal-dependent hydrolase [Caloramator sp. CAR-1]